MSGRPERVMVVMRFAMPDGSLLERSWTMADLVAHQAETGEHNPVPTAPPAWLKNPKRKWPRPQDPITFTGKVREGHEADARALLGMSEATERQEP